MSHDPASPPDDLDLTGIEPPKWPKVVGIISIVWGSIGLVCVGCGAASPFLSGMFMPPEMMNPPPPWAQPSPLMFASLGVSLIVTTVLIIAGAVTVGRKPAGKPLHLAYVVLGLLSMAFGIYVQLQQQAAIRQWALDNPDNPLAKSMQGGGIGQSIGMAFGIFLGAAYPLFCLVWFGFLGKRPDRGPAEAGEGV
ncbi:MAG: hypothetical protein FJ255_04350 [Phycisphaerae bacterium]|nr:hypothetical protein [Phycisphaerae bacterium]